MGLIHQLYCTHCTLGTSAVERRKGEVASRVLGYGPRASSFAGESLRNNYRHVERYMRYLLPADVPAEDRPRLTAAEAPRRLFFAPSANNLQIMGLVSYRTRDTAGRPGSYFAHVLMSEPGADAWSAADCLQLWGAGWTDSDPPEGVFDLPPLGSLAELRNGAPPGVDDEVLRSFLVTPCGEPFYDPLHLIPNALREMSPDDRAKMLIRILGGFLQLQIANRRESVLLVAEPGLAALLFYGVARLLPDGKLRQQISFSTYEPDVSRLNVSLAATTFANAGSDIKPESYQAAGFVYNVLNGKRSTRVLPNSEYAQLLVDELTRRGWGAVNDLLKQYAALGIERAGDLELLAKTRNFAPLLLDPHAELPDFDVTSNPLLAKYHLQIVRKLLADHGKGTARLESLVKTKRHLLLLNLIATEQAPPETLAAVKFLLERLPGNWFDQFLAAPPIAPKFKSDAVAEFICRQRRLPENCDAYWVAPNGSGVTGFFPQVLVRLPAPVLEQLAENTKGTPQWDALLTGLIEAYRADPGKAYLHAVLVRGLAALPPDRLYTFLDRYADGTGNHVRWNEIGLARHLDKLLFDLPNAGGHFSRRLDVLYAWREFFTQPNRAGEVLASWIALRLHLQRLGETSAPTQRGKPSRNQFDLDATAKNVAIALVGAMSPALYTEDPDGSWRLNRVKDIGRALLRRDDYLPAPLWDKIGLYAESAQTGPRSGYWVAPTVSSFRSRSKTNWPIILPFAIVGGLLLIWAVNRVIGIISESPTPAQIAKGDPAKPAPAATSPAAPPSTIENKPVPASPAPLPSKPLVEDTNRERPAGESNPAEKPDPTKPAAASEKSPSGTPAPINAGSKQTPPPVSSEPAKPKEQNLAPPAAPQLPSGPPPGDPLRGQTPPPKTREKVTSSTRYPLPYPPILMPMPLCYVGSNSNLRILGIEQANQCFLAEEGTLSDPKHFFKVPRQGPIATRINVQDAHKNPPGHFSINTGGSLGFQWDRQLGKEDTKCLKWLAACVIDNGTRYVALCDDFRKPDRLPLVPVTGKMSKRAEIVIPDGHKELFVIRQSDLRLGGGVLHVGSQPYPFGEPRGNEITASVPEFAKTLGVGGAKVTVRLQQFAMNGRNWIIYVDMEPDMALGGNNDARSTQTPEAYHALIRNVKNAHKKVGASYPSENEVSTIDLSVKRLAERLGKKVDRKFPTQKEWTDFNAGDQNRKKYLTWVRTQLLEPAQQELDKLEAAANEKAAAKEKWDCLKAISVKLYRMVDEIRDDIVVIGQPDANDAATGTVADGSGLEKSPKP
jgi:hypothetical protein